MPFTILYIDRDKSHSKAIRAYLERQQFTVLTASTYDEALLIFDNLDPDIVIADPGWPETETAYLLKQVKQSNPDIQIIITYEEQHFDRVFDEMGTEMAGYLVKPIKSHLLDHALRQTQALLTSHRELYRCQNELKEYQRTQNLYQQLFNEAPCYISVQDRDFRLTATNRLFKRDFGDEIGSYCYKVYKHRDSRCQKCPVAATFEDGLPHPTEEIVTSKSGKQYNVMTWTAPIRNEEGEITQVMEMSTNITQIRQLQDHLTSLGLMLGSMSHGVKGMLTALDGGIYQLETGVEKKEMKRIEKALDQVKLMSGRIRKMVLEILYYAKSRALRYKSVDISGMAQKVAEMTRVMADKNGVDLKIDIQESMGMVDVDPNWMQAALMNFMENAVDACTYDREKSDHTVRFDVFESAPDMICFIIRDNGMGMDQETKDKMFTLFFTSKGSQGTGLGLFIANRVITQHGGTIKVETQPREGSSFQICLPRYRPDPAQMIEFPNNNNNSIDS